MPSGNIFQQPEYQLLSASDEHEEEFDQHLQVANESRSNTQQKTQKRPKAALVVVLCIVAIACWEVYSYFQFPPNKRRNAELNNTMPGEGKYSVG